MTQCDRILRHLQDYGEITTMDAFQDYGITRLSGRIFELRQRGHTIVSVHTPFTNRYGEKKYYATYRLEGTGE